MDLETDHRLVRGSFGGVELLLRRAFRLTFLLPRTDRRWLTMVVRRLLKGVRQTQDDIVFERTTINLQPHW